MRLLTFLFSLGVLGYSSSGFSYSSFPTAVNSSAKNLFGASASYNYSCVGCHGSSGYTIATGFGSDFVKKSNSLFPNTPIAALSSAQIQSIIDGIQTIDSDNDSFSNKDEFLAATNPGDSGSHPTPAPVCTKASPQLNLQPPSQSGTAGSLLTYSLTIANKDSAACSPVTFALSSSLPLGLSGTFDVSSVVLTPGQSILRTISISSSATLSAASYSFNLIATDQVDAAHKNQVSGTYVVQPPVSTCTRSAPTVSIQPSIQSGADGSTLQYAVSIVNNDSATCAQTDFNLTTALPAGLDGALNPMSVSLTPGSSGKAQLDVTSLVGTSAGNKSFSVTATDPAIAGHVGSGTGVYTVLGQGDSESPTAPSNVSYRLGRKAIAIKWSPSTDNVGVVKYTVWVDGNLVGETSSLRIRLPLPSPGGHEIIIKAHDAAGNVSNGSAPVSLSIAGKFRSEKNRERQNKEDDDSED